MRLVLADLRRKKNEISCAGSDGTVLFARERDLVAWIHDRWVVVLMWNR